MHALGNGLAIPRNEIHADLALGGQSTPVAPHVRAFDLLRRGRGKSVGLDVVGIHPLVELVDSLALAGAINTTHQNNHGKAVALCQLELRIQQRLT